MPDTTPTVGAQPSTNQPLAPNPTPSNEPTKGKEKPLDKLIRTLLIGRGFYAFAFALLTSVLLGPVIGYFIYLMALIALPTDLAQKYFSSSYYTNLACVVAYFYWLSTGFAKININFLATPLFFGIRVNRHLEEGLWWIIPWPFMSLEPEDARRDPITISVENVRTKDGGIVTVDVTGIMKISDPFKVLGIKQKVMDEGIKALIQKETREEAKDFKTDDFCLKGNEISEKLTKEARTLAKDWGVEIRVLVTKISLPEELQKAYNKVLIERKELQIDRLDGKAKTANIEKLIQRCKLDPKDAEESETSRRGEIDRISVRGGDTITAGILAVGRLLGSGHLLEGKKIKGGKK